MSLSGDRVESPVQVPGLLAGLGQGGPGQLHLEPRHRGAEGPGPRVQDVSRPQVLREKQTELHIELDIQFNNFKLRSKPIYISTGCPSGALQ